MQKVLNELNKGNNVLIETEKLDEFLSYSLSLPDLHSYRLEYSENLVKITLVDKIIISKNESKDL